MFAGETDGAEKAARIAGWFSDYTEFKSHGRRVSRDEARGLGLKVVDLEADDVLQDRILAVHHAVQHTLSGTGLVKGIENHHGRAWFIVQHLVLSRVLPHLHRLQGRNRYSRLAARSAAGSNADVADTGLTTYRANNGGQQRLTR